MWICEFPPGQTYGTGSSVGRAEVAPCVAGSSPALYPNNFSYPAHGNSMCQTATPNRSCPDQSIGGKTMVIPTVTPETITSIFTNTAAMVQQGGLAVCGCIFAYNMCSREWSNSEYKKRKAIRKADKAVGKLNGVK